MTRARRSTDRIRAHPLPPVVDGGKETKGRILVIAGSRAVPGAALLTATAAMRAGAGKLRIATVAGIAAQIGTAMPEAMVIDLPESRDGGFAAAASDRIAKLVGEADAVVAGPGIKPKQVLRGHCPRLLDVEAALDARRRLSRNLRRARRSRAGAADPVAHTPPSSPRCSTAATMKSSATRLAADGARPNAIARSSWSRA